MVQVRVMPVMKEYGQQIGILTEILGRGTLLKISF